MSGKFAEEFADPEITPSRLRAFWRRASFVTPQSLKSWIASDLSRLGLWTPVAIGIGAGFYFSLKSEPHAAIGIIALALSALFLSRHRRFSHLVTAIFLASLGFVAADWRTASVNTIILSEELSIRPVEGRLISRQETARAQRLLIAVEGIEGVENEDLPQRVRISWRGDRVDAAPGDYIVLRAGLRPPPPPAIPGGFDFARQLYFEKVGAVGFAVSAPVITRGSAKTFVARTEALRAALLDRITSEAPGQGGAIVAAIVTGKRDAITGQSENALRDTGLAHLLAISGLHMGLATGLIFFVVRLGFALIPSLALHFPIKKWAAAAALLSGLVYLLISGGGWSARRAFIMAAIIFIAILVDRRGLSLRNVAIAATLILLTTPEALFHAGFQMSFAAVTALIAGYEWMTSRERGWQGQSVVVKLRRYVVGLAITDLIAAIATAPFALYHFNRVAIYSLPANMLAMPLMAFWIIPAAIVALLLTPFGLDGWAWRLSAEGMDVILAIAGDVSSWRGAVSLTPQWPLLALLLLTLGGLWLCLARSPLRFVGLAAIPMAWGVIGLNAPPQIFVAETGLNAGVIAPGISEAEAGKGERLYVFSPRRDRFAASIWREAAGFDASLSRAAPLADIAECDQSGCILKTGEKQTVSFLSNHDALREDCARADLVIAFFPASNAEWRDCNAMLIDRRSVWRRGAHAIWVAKDGVPKIKTVNESRGERPWTGGD